MSDWFFYIGPPLSFPVLLGVFSSFKQPRLRPAIFAAITTTIALASCVYTMPHYAAPATILIYVFAVEGLHYLWQLGRHGERAFVVAVCITVVIASLARQTGSTAMNSKFTFPDTRRLAIEHLETEPGKQLVLVSYDLERHYPGNELVHNGADFNSEKVLWARSKGAEGDSELCALYPGRTFWRLTTDDQHMSLNRIDLCK